MKKIIIYLISVFIIAGIVSCGEKSTTIKVKNNTNIALNDVLVKIKIDELQTKIDFSDDRKILVEENENPVSFQIIKKDEKPFCLLFVTNFYEGEEKKISILQKCKNIETVTFPKKTQAELVVKQDGEWVLAEKPTEKRKYEYKGGEYHNVTFSKRPEHNSNNVYYYKYEGVGWESDKVAYRLYFDWRNAIDIFGKKVDTMVLQIVGLTGDNYHYMHEWGMDIFKVGESLGIGAVGMWYNNKAHRVEVTDSATCEIVENGNVLSKIVNNYYGWTVGETKVDLNLCMSIHAGSRLTKQKLSVSEEVNNLCTGIHKLEGSELIKSENNEGEWAYLATYGPQSFLEDNLGLAILYKKDKLIELTEDEYSYVVVLKPEDKQVVYYSLAAWEQEKHGIKTKDQFVEYLNTELIKLNKPVEIIY